MFIKKLKALLLKAEEEKIVDSSTTEKLLNLALNNRKIRLTFSPQVIANVFGGLLLALSIVLLVAHNFYKIPDIVKIGVLLASMLSLVLLYNKIEEKHPKLSFALESIIGIMPLAAIGLIAQIFHLSSNDGSALLLWLIMLLPLFVITKNKLQGIMAMFAYVIWFSFYLSANTANYVSLTLHPHALITLNLLYFIFAGKNALFLKISNILLGTCIWITILSCNYQHLAITTPVIPMLAWAVIFLNILLLAWIFYNCYRQKTLNSSRELILSVATMATSACFLLDKNITIYWHYWLLLLAEIQILKENTKYKKLYTIVFTIANMVAASAISRHLWLNVYAISPLLFIFAEEDIKPNGLIYLCCMPVFITLLFMSDETLHNYHYLQNFDTAEKVLAFFNSLTIPNLALLASLFYRQWKTKTFSTLPLFFTIIIFLDLINICNAGYAVAIISWSLILITAVYMFYLGVKTQDNLSIKVSMIMGFTVVLQKFIITSNILSTSILFFTIGVVVMLSSRLLFTKKSQ